MFVAYVMAANGAATGPTARSASATPALLLDEDAGRVMPWSLARTAPPVDLRQTWAEKGVDGLTRLRRVQAERSERNRLRPNALGFTTAKSTHEHPARRALLRRPDGSPSLARSAAERPERRRLSPDEKTVYYAEIFQDGSRREDHKPGQLAKVWVCCPGACTSGRRPAIPSTAHSQCKRTATSASPP